MEIKEAWLVIETIDDMGGWPENRYFGPYPTEHWAQSEMAAMKVASDGWGTYTIAQFEPKWEAPKNAL
jgi:hypothetical protein